MNNLFQLRFVVAWVLFFGFTISNSFAYLQMVIPGEQSTCQGSFDGDGTCWAACCDMILNAYQYYTTQPAIINWALTATCDDNQVNSTCSGNSLTGFCTSADMVLYNFGPIGTDPIGYMLQSPLISEIDGGRPILAHWLNSNGSGHDVLIKGYTGAGGTGDNADVGNIIYNDPVDVNTHTLAYGAFVNASCYPTWDGTLKLTTDPVIPIPTPVGSTKWIAINSGGTTVITSTTSSLTYSAKNDFSPTTWNWRLILSDENGDIVIYSATQSNSSMKSTWNITNFTLPAGHQWNYNHYGKIPGRVEITATLGTTTASAAEDVVFVPSILYPGNIVFVNETVSSTHADVKAHNSIETISDAIQPTGSINFIAGNLLNIQQPLTISNGSKITFKIDPTLQ